ncbi:dynein axonemal assembly factor 1 homolog [Drosophila santomea]|uniref:dynein axonemal assembly factor 1 homolog n=1 Tax=Drosophila santomea TaxID=129105 RepID=UPI001CCE384E|nr:dynein axonemal assembly factor 1 homolog [Drosophila santomea]
MSLSNRKEITGLTRMTPKGLKELCKKDKLYQTPRLNDTLYLHYQGFQCIEHLEEYTELKCLWLECNAISEIQGLEKLSKLKCLFLQNNLITKIENLEPCRELDTLNLSSNHIRKIQNIGNNILPVLNTLTIASNYLKDSESLSDLVQCKTLSVLDLSNNRIDDILIVKIFEQMLNLKVLVLQGNPVVSRLPQYRKTLILACKELTYLDSRPVFPRDRACAEAWKRDGYEGERKENNRWNRAERRKTRESINCTIRIRNSHRPPDQQDPLLRSSDSEDDTCTGTTLKKVVIENGCVDDIWKEVSCEHPTSESGASTSSSVEDNDATSSQDDLIAEKLSNRGTLEGRPKVLNETEGSNLKRVNQNIKNVEPRNIQTIVFEEDVSKKSQVIIEEENVPKINLINEPCDLNDKKAIIVKCKKTGYTSIGPVHKETVFHEDAEIKKMEDVVLCQDFIKSDEHMSSEKLEKDFEQTCTAPRNEAQCKEFDEDQKIIEIESKLIYEMYESFAADDDDKLNETFDLNLYETTSEHQAHKVSFDENKMPMSCYQEDKDILLPKSMEETLFEEECFIANDKCAHDLEEIGRQMDEDLAELRQSTQNVVGLSKDEIAETDIETDEEDLIAQQDPYSPLLKQQFKNRRMKIMLIEESKAQGESQRDLNITVSNESGGDDKQDQLFARILDDATENIPKRIFGTGCDALSYNWPQEECLLQLTLSEVKETPAQECTFKNSITNSSSFEEANKICVRMDQKMAEEEEALGKLLHDLENEAENVYEINTKMTYEGTTSSKEVVSICTSLLDDIIVELTLNEILWHEKPKSFKFGPIESDEEFSYSLEPQLEKLVPPALEDPARGKSLRECLDTFSDFVSSMADPKLPLMLGRNPTLGVEKIRAAQELLKSKNLAEIYADSAESLNSQVAKEIEKRKRRVAATATRCFNQRDKYDDTLELVNNRLMIVKRDSGDLEELPPPPPLISDSESEDYDTADDEYTPGNGGHKLGSQPKDSKNLVTNSLLKQKQADSDVVEEVVKKNNHAEDEFYSLEAMTTFSSLDAEFFQKLDLQKVNDSEDSEPAKNCMRNYNELQAYMKSGSLNHRLNTEETKTLQTRFSTVGSDESKTKLRNPQEGKEDALLKKMVLRMKEYEEREHQLQLVPHELGSIKLSLGGSKLFEQTPETVLVHTENEPTSKIKLIDNKKTNNDESTHPIKSYCEPLVRASCKTSNKNIDDDIQSDVSTDYESGEEVVVVEPPKLSEAVLKSFYSDGFEADLNMVHELEEDTRRNLYCYHSNEMLNPTKNHPFSLKKTLSSKTSTNELTVGAKAKWAKIAERLHEFLDPETISKLNKEQFGESDEFEDSQDDNIFTDITFEENNSKKYENLVSEECNCTQSIYDENSCPSELNGNDQFSGLKEINKDKEMPTCNLELNSVMIQSKKKTSEILPNEIGNIIKACSSFEAPPTDPIGIKYFEDPTLTQMNPEFLKTKQIECNLQILSEDGDVVVQELSVNAQVSFE